MVWGFVRYPCRNYLRIARISFKFELLIENFDLSVTLFKKQIKKKTSVRSCLYGL